MGGMFVWTIRDVISITFFAIFAALFIIFGLRNMWKQSRCAHSRYHETSACDAICLNCGKNLGFIGTVRERNKQGEAR